MDVQNILKGIEETNKKVKEIVDVNRPLKVDVGNLTAWDSDNIVLPKAGAKREDYFRNLAREIVQVVLNQLYELNGKEELLELPEPTTILPRGKRVPEPKPPTKWEQFARNKGIKDKKREKLVYDEVTRKWVPRYGYNKKKNEDEKDWLIEIPDQADPNVDYFAKRKEDKKERVAKNKYQQLRNVARTRN